MSEYFLHNPILIAIGTLISEDLTYFASLFLIQGDQLAGLTFVFWYSLGVVLGDLGLYGIGYLMGIDSKSKLITKVSHFTQKYFPNDPLEFSTIDRFLIFTRCIPGSRIPTYVACGISRYSLLRFTLILGAAVIIYSIVGLALVKSIGTSAQPHWPYKLGISLLAFLISNGLFVLIFKVWQLKKEYGQISPLLWIKFVRLRRLEFWPSFYFYLPFVPVFLLLLFRYLRFTPLSSNPGIFMSGIKGENKSEIDKLIARHLPENHLKTFKLQESNYTDKKALEMFLHNHQLCFPLVVKPDSGLRGGDVSKVLDIDHLFKLIADKPQQKHVVQRLSPYEKEWGVFFYKIPGTQVGDILSVNDKIFPFVIGDGKSTLLKLILDEPELRIRFDWVTLEKKDQIHSIPKKGEKIPLVFRGNHSKGCIFKQADRLMTSSIKEQLVNRLSKLEGFYIGRIDIRFKDYESLSRGEFDIIEINGAGAEPTAIYDPDLKPFEVYTLLFHQWRLSFKIGSMLLKDQSAPFHLIPFLALLVPALKTKK